MKFDERAICLRFFLWGGGRFFSEMCSPRRAGQRTPTIGLKHVPDMFWTQPRHVMKGFLLKSKVNEIIT